MQYHTVLKDLILKLIRKSGWPQIARKVLRNTTWRSAYLSDVKVDFRATARQQWGTSTERRTEQEGTRGQRTHIKCGATAVTAQVGNDVVNG